MGGDYYGGRDVVSTTSTTGYSQAAAEAVGMVKSLQPQLDPKRWKEENLQCESLHPIVFALDVTGSMGDWSKIIYDKMPMFYGQIMMQKYLTDPAISFCAVGDSHCDKVPLQVSEFGQGKGIDQLLSKMFLGGGGGGNNHESYDLAANFYSNHVDLINAEIPFFFITGDEGFWDKETASEVEKVFGHGMKQTEIHTKILWDKLLKMYNVFHIKKPFKNKLADKTIDKQWKNALGEERVLHITEPKACVDIMLGAISITSGVRDLKGYIDDMTSRGQTKERIVEVKKALKPYADKVAKGEILVVKNKVNVIPTDETHNSKVSQTSEKQIKIESLKMSDVDLEEIRLKTQSLLLEELEQEEAKYLNDLQNLFKLKGESVPKEFVCPLTKKIMFDPVLTFDGHSFERKAVEIFLEKHDNLPFSQNPIDSKILLPNFALKQLIRDYLDSSK